MCREIRMEIEVLGPDRGDIVDVRGDLVVLGEIGIESALQEVDDPV